MNVYITDTAYAAMAMLNPYIVSPLGSTEGLASVWNKMRNASHRLSNYGLKKINMQNLDWKDVVENVDLHTKDWKKATLMHKPASVPYDEPDVGFMGVYLDSSTNLIQAFFISKVNFLRDKTTGFKIIKRDGEWGIVKPNEYSNVRFYKGDPGMLQTNLVDLRNSR